MPICPQVDMWSSYGYLIRYQSEDIIPKYRDSNHDVDY